MINNTQICENDAIKYKKIVLEMMADFDIFLLKHGVAYSLDGGTLLGAIRHHGWIPWDDDIDIILEKEQYYKLLKVINDFNSEKYEVVMPFTTKFSNCRMIKIFRKDVSILEENCNFFEGPFIDVFYAIDIPFQHSILNRMYLGVYRFITMAYDIKNGRIDTSLLQTPIVKMEQIFGNIIPKRVLKLIIESFISYSNDNASFVTSYGSFYPHNKKIFNEYEKVPFEEYYFLSVKEYDAYLKKVFGDYMKLPPIEDQVSHHIRFIDFNTPYNNNDV